MLQSIRPAWKLYQNYYWYIELLSRLQDTIYSLFIEHCLLSLQASECLSVHVLLLWSCQPPNGLQQTRKILFAKSCQFSWQTWSADRSLATIHDQWNTPFFCMVHMYAWKNWNKRQWDTTLYSLTENYRSIFRISSSNSKFASFSLSSFIYGFNIWEHGLIHGFLTVVSLLHSPWIVDNTGRV